MDSVRKKYTTVLIDLDGTLTDSRPGVTGAVCYALNKLGIPIPENDTLPLFIGPPLLESFKAYCGMDDETAAKALEAYREYYRAGGMFENDVYEGIYQMLERLKSAGLRLAVATSKPEVFSLQILSHFALDKYFDVIAGATLDESRNNKPKVIAYALKELKIEDTSEAVMVGDRHHDVEGAAKFGIGCIGVTYGYGSEKELLDAGALCLAATPAEVADIIIGKS